MTKRNDRRRRALARGMTLIEVMVVLVILGLITGAVVVAVIPQLEKAKRDRAALDIKNIQSGLTQYYARKGNYPDTATGLKALLDMQILENVPKDPWDNEYVYMNEGGKSVIVSYGRDGVQGGEGPDEDISSRDASKAK